MFSEMRAFAKAFPELSPTAVLSCATVNAARALNRENELGFLKLGAAADLIAVPHASGDATEAVLSHRGDVTASMIRGQWALPPTT